MSSYNTNFIATINGVQQDLGNILYNWSSNTINISAAGLTLQRYPIQYKKPTIILESDITATMDGYPNYGDQVITFGPQQPNQNIAVNSSGGSNLAISTNGIKYYGVPSSIYTSAIHGYIAYNGRIWVCVTEGPTNIGYSYDGVNWVITSNTTATNGYTSLCWTGKMWLIGGKTSNTGTSSSMLYSYDGINWTAIPSTASIIQWVWNITTNGNIIIAVGCNYDINVSKTAYSYDGITWQTPAASLTTVISQYITSIIWIGNRWIAGGNGTFAYTNDPLGLTGWTTTGFSTTSVYTIKWNGGLAIGGGGGGNGTLYYSYNGSNWTSLGSSTFGSSLTSVMWNGRFFEAVGTNGGATIAYSKNGLNWNSVVSSPFNGSNGDIRIAYNEMRPHSIRFNRRLTIATMSGTSVGNTLLYSYDGIAWTGLGTNVFNTNAFSVAYNGRIWVGGGQGGNTMGFSPNGIEWRGLGSSAFTTSCNTVVWNNVKNMWLAGGQGTNVPVQYSYDGYTWIPTVSSPFSTICNGFSYNKSIMVAVGAGTNTMATSTNGISWTGIGSPVSTTSMNGIATNGYLWIAVGVAGSAGKILYSYNGTTWIDTGYAGFSTGAYAVSYNQTMWVAVGSGSTSVAYSYNGVQWNNGPNLFSIQGYGVKWNGSLWLVTGKGTGNNTSYSYDGVNWIGNNLGGNTEVIPTSFGITSAPSSNWWSITTNSTGQYIIAGADGGGIYISSNYGSTWVQTSAPINKRWIGVTTDSTGQYLAACIYGDGIYKSSNYGSTWSQTSAPNNFNYSSITSNSTGKYLAASRINWGTGGGYIVVSTDYGSTWTESTAIGRPYYSIVSNNTGQYMASCTLGYGVFISNNYGSSWTQTTITSGTWYSITSDSTGKYLATCPNPGYINISSNYGSTWNATTAYGIWQCITSDSTGQYLAAGSFGYIYTSSNYGSTWVQSTSPSANWYSITSADSKEQYSSVINGGGIYKYTESYTIASTVTNSESNYQIQPRAFIQHPTLAFGSGQNSIAYSPDGINWTGLGTNIFSTQGRKAFWNGKIWVAAGSGTNTLAYSYDGITWTGLGASVITGQVNGVLYNGQIWVAAGQGTYSIAYSYDGIKWIGVVGSASIFSTAGYGLSWNGRTWIATGYGTNTIAVSTNGITWTAVSNSNSATTGTVHPATNGSIWVVPVNSSVGLMYSSVANGQSGWTNVASSPFSTGGLCVTWNGSIWVAGGAGTYKIAYSTNGTTWSGVSTTFSSVNDIVWNGTRFIATGGSSIGYSTDGINWYINNNIMTNGYGLASNSGVGAFVAPSALVLNDTGITGNAMTASRTLEVVSSDPYFQTGFNNIAVKIETQNLY